MKLSDFKPNHPLVKDLEKYLNQAFVKQDKVLITELGKSKRVAGVSALPIIMQLENGQSITAYVCVAKNGKGKDQFELFRVEVNGKEIPTAHGFSKDKAVFAKAVDDIAKVVLAGQKRFDKKRAKDGMAVEKVVQKRTNETTKDKLKAVQDELAKLNEQIAQDESIKDELTAELAKLTEQLNR